MIPTSFLHLDTAPISSVVLRSTDLHTGTPAMSVFSKLWLIFSCKKLSQKFWYTDVHPLWSIYPPPTNLAVLTSSILSLHNLILNIACKISQIPCIVVFYQLCLLHLLHKFLYESFNTNSPRLTSRSDDRSSKDRCLISVSQFSRFCFHFLGNDFFSGFQPWCRWFFLLVVQGSGLIVSLILTYLFK